MSGDFHWVNLFAWKKLRRIARISNLNAIWGESDGLLKHGRGRRFVWSNLIEKLSQIMGLRKVDLMADEDGFQKCFGGLLRVESDYRAQADACF